MLPRSFAAAAAMDDVPAMALRTLRSRMTAPPRDDSVEFYEDTLVSMVRATTTWIREPFKNGFTQAALLAAAEHGMAHATLPHGFDRDVARKALEEVDGIQDRGAWMMALSTLLTIFARSLPRQEVCSLVEGRVTEKARYDLVAHSALLIRLQTIRESGQEGDRIIPASVQYLNHVDFKKLSTDEQVELVRSVSVFKKNTLKEKMASRTKMRVFIDFEAEKRNAARALPFSQLAHIEARVMPDSFEHPECFVSCMNCFSDTSDMQRFYDFWNVGKMS